MQLFRLTQLFSYLFSVDTYSSHEGQLYCKPHFKELFKPKAVLDEDSDMRKYIFFRVLVNVHGEVL